MIFQFDSDGTSRLRWSRLDERGFCERTAQYKTDGQILEQMIVWTSPENRPDCGKDPDMQIGRQTQTIYRVTGGRLETDFGLGDEILTYIWESIPAKK
jgi:hypothetical protein